MASALSSPFRSSPGMESTACILCWRTMEGMEVAVHQFDGVSTFQSLPLAAGLLVASARRDPLLRAEATLTVRTARVDPDDAVPDRADVLAYSMYVWNEPYTLEVARRARERHPDAFVVLGGPSVPRRPGRAEEFLRE